MPLGFAALTVVPVSTITTVNKNAFTANSVAAASSAGSIANSSGKANHTPAATTATFGVDDLTSVRGEGIPSVLTSLPASITANTMAELIGEGNVTPPAVTASFVLDAVALSVIASANIDSNALVLNLTASNVDFDAEANITTGTVAAPASANALASIQGKANTSLFSVSAEIFINTEQPTAVTFPYELYKDQFDRLRTIYLVDYSGNLGDTVFINPENRTVFVSPQDRRKTVFITR